MLLDSIKKDLKIAMKAKETLKISTLRMITSSIKNIEINNRTSSKDESSNESLSDNEIIQLLTKMIKQRKESAEIYKESDRSDLEKKENDEIEIIEQYMPSQINDDEIDKLINEIIDETGSSSIKDMGRVMTILKEKYSGQMDFGKASLTVKDGVLSFVKGDKPTNSFPLFLSCTVFSTTWDTLILSLISFKVSVENFIY